ncbi:MAG: HlyC/CorC family transporter, partial [Ignavibacteriales bacterium]
MDYFLLRILVVLILIFLAGFLSAAEIAIATFGQNKIEELKEKKDKIAEAFEDIQKRSDSFFGTTQITYILLIVISSIISFNLIFYYIATLFAGSEINFFSEFSMEIGIIISLLAVTFLVVIFGNLIPKSLGFRFAEKIGKSTVKPLLLLTKIFEYPVKWITSFSNLMLKPFNERTSFSQTRFSEDEIRIIISEGVKSGALNETEQEIIENVFEFNDLRAYEVMIPRTEMISLGIVEDIKEITEEVIKSAHSLIPVYEENVDNIIGVLHTKDFMRTLIEEKPVKLRTLVRPAYFVPESKLISEILKEMQKRGERLAIVMDEYGGTEGVITMEDIIEEIVGEFTNNNDKESSDYSRLADGKFYVLGSMMIDDFNETFNINLPESDEYNTVAGFIADKSGRILNTGDIVQHEDLVFELIKKLRQKMVQF